MAAASRLATTTAVFTTPSGDLDTDGESAVQERSMQLRAAIEQHVAEAAAREREELLDLVDSYAKDNTDLKDAVRARAEKETK